MIKELSKEVNVPCCGDPDLRVLDLNGAAAFCTPITAKELGVSQEEVDALLLADDRRAAPAFLAVYCSNCFKRRNFPLDLKLLQEPQFSEWIVYKGEIK